MFDTLKKTMLASLGAVAFNKDRLKSLIEDLVARGEISREQGATLFDTLISRGQAESEEISAKLCSEVQSLKDYLPVQRKDFQALEARVKAIEAFVGLENNESETSDSDSDAPEEFPGEALPPREE